MDLRGEVVVDDERHLLDIDTTCPDISGDENTPGTESAKHDTRHDFAYEDPLRNSAMIASLSFCTISPCIDETVKFAALIFSVNQSTCTPALLSPKPSDLTIPISPFFACCKR